MTRLVHHVSLGAGKDFKNMNIYKVNNKIAIEKLKELKIWAQVKSPKSLQPALSYTLDWLAPELLGTGFQMKEADELAFKALVPATSSNLDFQNEIHQGLVLNAGLEMGRAFLQKQMGESFFKVSGSEIKIIKNQTWNEELELFLKVDQSTLDDFFISLHKRKEAEISFEIIIKIKNTKKTDLLKLTLDVEKIELLA